MTQLAARELFAPASVFGGTEVFLCTHSRDDAVDSMTETHSLAEFPRMWTRRPIRLIHGANHAMRGTKVRGSAASRLEWETKTQGFIQVQVTLHHLKRFTLRAACATVTPRVIPPSDNTPVPLMSGCVNTVYTEEKNRKHIGSRHFFELSNTFRPLGSEPFRTESGREEVLD